MARAGSMNVLVRNGLVNSCPSTTIDAKISVVGDMYLELSMYFKEPVMGAS